MSISNNKGIQIYSVDTLVRCLTEDPKVMSSNVINKTHSELTYGSHRESVCLTLEVVPFPLVPLVSTS